MSQIVTPSLEAAELLSVSAPLAAAATRVLRRRGDDPN